MSFIRCVDDVPDFIRCVDDVPDFIRCVAVQDFIFNQDLETESKVETETSHLSDPETEHVVVS